MDIQHVFERLTKVDIDQEGEKQSENAIDPEFLGKLYTLLKEQDLAKLSQGERSLLSRNLQILDTKLFTQEEEKKTHQVVIGRLLNLPKKSYDQAKKDADLSPKTFIQNVEQYALEDPKQLQAALRVAVKKCISADHNLFWTMITPSDIPTSQVAALLLKIAAEMDGSGVSEHIQNYGIKDQTTLIEIAKIAAAQNGMGVSEYIQNYGIEEESDRASIAKIAISQCPNTLNLSNYQITDQKLLQG